jgi:tRNA threonylcarbamoyladenosine biosynthesis protein TsaE
MKEGINPDFTTNSEEETIVAGEDFAKRLLPGDTVALFGDLGSGKTEFVKGICNFFKVDDIVTSPTFSIMNQYKSHKSDLDMSIYHIDLYRIKKEELREIGLQECVQTNKAIKLVEWAEKAEGIIPSEAYKVTIEPSMSDENRRFIYIQHS